GEHLPQDPGPSDGRRQERLSHVAAAEGAGEHQPPTRDEELAKPKRSPSRPTSRVGRGIFLRSATTLRHVILAVRIRLGATSAAELRSAVVVHRPATVMLLQL